MLDLNALIRGVLTKNRGMFSKHCVKQLHTLIHLWHTCNNPTGISLITIFLRETYLTSDISLRG